MGRKLESGLHPLLGREAWCPYNIVDWAEAYHHAQYQVHSSRRLATTNMGRRFGAPLPFWVGGAGPRLTQSPGRRPSSIPSDILIHAAIWPQQIWAENWGLCLFGGGGDGSHLTQCGRARDLPACKFHLDPCKRLATVHELYRQIDKTNNGPIA